jgi:outer membrane protein TolC
MPPPGFTVDPDPRSRFCDPTPPDDPLLPIPAPRLYAYDLPELPERDPRRFRNPSAGLDEQTPKRVVENPVCQADSGLTPAARQAGANGGAEWRICDGEEAVQGQLGSAQPIARHVAYQAQEPAELPLDQPPGMDVVVGRAEELTLVPIPQPAWESLPTTCLSRMFEFQTVRDEYRRTFGREPSADQRDQSQRLALEDIVQLALINSRAYQTEKEQLYSAALDLSLDRYAYELKFATSGNRSAANYTHDRDNGATTNTLGLPYSIRGEAFLASGGQLAAELANDVLLTFNGSNGFAADIGSELLFEASQSIFQRDVVFEPLTRAEREVVYAARNLARFRKTLFRDLADTYYGLLLSYRSIEIAAEDYFSNLRGFNQAEAEYRAGRLPRFQVDQFEQQALESRRNLITACNDLESGLDRLKFAIGLPPELPLNLHLTELDELTLRDEITVAAERVRRGRRSLVMERSQPELERGVLLNSAIDLVGKILTLQRLRQRAGQEVSDIASLQLQLAELSAEEARLEVQFNRNVLDQEKTATPAAPPLRVFQRTMDLVESLQLQVSRELDVVDMRGASDQAAVTLVRAGLTDLEQRHEQLRNDLQHAVTERQLDRIPTLVQTSQALLADAERLAARTAALLPASNVAPGQELQATLRQADQLIAESQEVLDAEAGGLVPVEIDMNDAMLTALTLRYDLMNERGSVADAWRGIKLVGDSLRSVLELRARQQIRTRDGSDRPFDFTFDESRTSLQMTLDSPFNRRRERNAFRQTLINYNLALRNLLNAEDQIKLDVRDDLRALQFDRERYGIDVASAALAYERGVSTRLQLRLGAKDVTARDVLEAQRDYTRALIALAGSHTRFIRNRISLFTELELLEVDPNGFWPHLYNERYQPTPNYGLPDYAMPAYGELPHGVWYSHQVKRMLDVPPGESVIFQPDSDADREDVPSPQPDEMPGNE